MKPMGGWRSDLHAAKARERNVAIARQPAVYSWSLARTEMKLVLLPPTKGQGQKSDILRRILYHVPELEWNEKRNRYTAPLSKITLQQIRKAASFLPSANVSNGVRQYINAKGAQAKGLSPMMFK